MHGADWQDWPRSCGPRRPAATGGPRDLGERVHFYCWLQWVLDKQLGQAQRLAVEAGMPVGVVHDLAVGVPAAPTRGRCRT